MTEAVPSPARGPLRAVVFDLDGTLVDSTPDIAAAVNRTLARRGLGPLPEVVVHELTGHGGDELVRRAFAQFGVALDDEELREQTRHYLDGYGEAPAQRSVLFRDAASALAALKARELAIGVCTNKETELARRVMSALGIDGFVDAVVGADAGPPRKPDPAHLQATLAAIDAVADEAVYVGDNDIDARTARAAGVRYVMVGWGTRRDTTEPTWARIGRFGDLLELVAGAAPAGTP